MGAPAIVMGDRIMGTCMHLMPAKPSPIPGSMPFSAPLTDGLVSSVTIGGKAAAVMGSSGTCTPPHVTIDPSDPNFSPTMQVGRVVASSSMVLIGGKPAATTSATVTCCLLPGSLTPSVTTVLIG